ncbi:DUF6636 domain-containing protein [Aeromicrobium alkaliterrae]|uniref:Lipoprotein n=1 Tax=Aeromicrobium alkaliterrae TaxID=302168 RepID=A0ABN2JKS2_9ACTN
MSLRLLATVVVLTTVLAACNGGSDEEPDGSSAGDRGSESSAAPAEDEAGEPEGTGVEEPTGTPVDPAGFTDALAEHAFTSPTGNIVCYVNVTADQWGCVIGERSYTEPPGADDCFASFGKGFVSVQGGPLQPQCRGGVLAAAESGGGPTLAYGSTLTVGAVTCMSQQTGVTCVDERSGHGLFISKAAYALS